MYLREYVHICVIINNEKRDHDYEREWAEVGEWAWSGAKEGKCYNCEKENINRNW